MKETVLIHKFPFLQQENRELQLGGWSGLRVWSSPRPLLHAGPDRPHLQDGRPSPSLQWAERTRQATETCGCLTNIGLDAPSQLHGEEKSGTEIEINRRVLINIGIKL